jgi:hypothetical protein
MYEYELEKEFGMFRDLMEVIKLQRPDNELASDFEVDSDDDDAHVGLFKVSSCSHQGGSGVSLN